MIRIRTNASFLLAILTLNSSNVSAHEFWLEPSPFFAQENTSIDFDIRIGQNFGGRLYPFIERETVQFFVRDADGRRDISAVTGDKPAARIALTAPAVWVGYESADFNIRFNDSEKFFSYLNDEGLESVIDWYRDNNVDPKGATETYYRHAKALVWSNPSEPDWLTQPLGMRIELVPQPGFLACSQSPSFQVLHLNEPLEGHLVRRFQKDRLDADVALTDAKGMVTFTPKAGQFLLNVVTIDNSTNPRAKGKDWVSDWGSLTYACTQ